MVRIDRVHTGAGDAGDTSLVDGTRTSKSNPRIQIVGTLDEVNSCIGIVCMETHRLPYHSDGGDSSSIQRVQIIALPALQRIQNELFDLGAELGCEINNIPEYVTLLETYHSDLLLHEMEAWIKDTPPLTSFILPGGSPPATFLHLARTVTRRLERLIVQLERDQQGSIRPIVLQYVNRLSDWVFVLGRWISSTLGDSEPLWLPLNQRPSEKGIVDILTQMKANDADFDALD
ncbi:MAG: cob(I)yrinic acid a,c-diamide adenosyltransferase [archaeon]|jgi:cob(I)alamin adenosyltransferase|nr:cob(I)yrinic acid a,c-diamide adenosyltransferase [archaeon]